MEWKTVKLGEVCYLLTGFPFKGDLYAKDGIRVLRGENIGDKELHFDGRNDKRWNLPFDKIEQYSLREGDIVMQMDGNVGKNKARLLHDYIPMLIAQRVACLREKEGISDQRYLYFVITGTPFHQYLDSVKTGTSIQHISLKQIGDFEFPLPPLETQRRIAAILSSLDDKIENNNRINRNLEAQAQALFKSWFVDFEPWGGTMPEDWKEGTIADLVNLLNGFAFKSSDFVANGFYNLITIKGVQDGKMTTDGADHLDATPAKMPNWCLLKKGDILLSLTGNVGRCCLVDIENCLLNQRVAKLQPRAEYNRLFVYTLFCQEEMKSRMISISRGTAQMNLSPIETGKLSIIVPTDKVLEDFGMRYNGILDTILNNISESHRLAALRDTLLPKLMRGEISL